MYVRQLLPAGGLALVASGLVCCVTASLVET